MSPRIVQPMLFTKREVCPVDRSSSLTGRFSANFSFCEWHGLEEVAEQAASEEGLSVEGMQLFIMLSRTSVETGEGLIKRLDEL